MLHELIKTEMEVRYRRRQNYPLEEFLRRYPELGGPEKLPAGLLYEEYRVRQRHGTVTRVPFCCPLILGVDKKGDAADFGRRQQTASSRCEQKLSAKTLSLYLAIHSEARQPEYWHVMTCQPVPYDLRRPGIFD